jgi:hypothetical protein
LYGTQAEKSSGQGVYHIDFITGTYGYWSCSLPLVTFQC